MWLLYFLFFIKTAAQVIHIQGENQNQNENHDRRDLDNSFTINESTTGTITIYTNNGPIKGINGTFVGNKYYEWYLGIPYAKPPINELRFKAPQPLGKTFNCTQDLEKFLNDSNLFDRTAQENVTESDRKNYTLDANIYNETHPFVADTFSNSCMQSVDQISFPGFDSLPRNNNMSEDCLRLNIFLGAGANGSVLVFFHGGLNFYQSGSGSLSVYNATALAYKSRSIVVTVNYRLGIFGFGFLGHKSGVEGNMGLLDQQLALKWIYTNIGYFGGDNTKITIFGQGYGAAMATSHLFAEDSYPFFDGIIASSGTIKNLWAVSHPETILNNTLVVANNLTCTNDTTEDKIKCLQEKDAYEILNASLFVRNENQSIFQHPFTPISNDTLFFKGDLNLMIAQNDMKTNVDLVIGKVANESTLFMPFMLDNNKFNCKYDSKVSIYNETNQCYMNNNNLTEISNIVTKILKLPENYSSKIEAIYNVTENSRDQVSRLLSDVMFDCDIIKFALEYVNKTIAENIYFYEYRWNSSINPLPNWMGIVHGSDLELIFGYPYIDSSRYGGKTVSEEKEIKISEKIMMLFGQFANQTNKNEIWKAYNFTSNQALLIGEQFEKLNFNGSELQGLGSIKYETFISDTCNKLYALVDEYMNKTYVEVTTSDENIMNNTLVNSSLIDQTNYTYSKFVDGCDFNNTRVCPPNVTGVIDGKTEL
uniref:Acetylcholinesterase n=1 Tax=Parastrongyloides trichosuri TaxID=131310 RepID=A0A0N4ZGK3_PARTI